MLVLLTLIFFATGCEEKKPSPETESKGDEQSLKQTNQDATDSNVKNNTGSYDLNDFFDDNSELNSQVDIIFNKLNDSQRVAQMIVVVVGIHGKPESVVSNLIAKNRIGGVLLLKGSKSEFQKYVSNFKSKAAESNSIPLIFSADAEPSLINIKMSGVKKLIRQTQYQISKSQRNLPYRFLTS